MNQQQAMADQQRETALQAYLDHMSDLLLGNNTGLGSPSLRTAHQNDQTSQVARARTLTVLRNLDGKRKGIVLQFLHDAGLLGTASGAMAIVNLNGADLTQVNLSERANLSGANLSKADLSGADLRGADLSGANLTETKLSNANLSDANLTSATLAGGVNLSYAILKDANLTAAILTGGANLSNANLSDANLTGATLAREVNLADTDLTGGANLSNANLSDANFSSSRLAGTVFQKADLSGTDMWQADLRQTNLDGANLSGADLSTATISTGTSFVQATYTKRTYWPGTFDPQKVHAVKTDRRLSPAFVDFNIVSSFYPLTNETSSLHYHLANAALKTDGVQARQNDFQSYLILGGGQQVAIEFDLQKDDLAKTMVTVNGLVAQNGANNAGYAPISLQLNGHPAFESNFTMPGGGYQATSQPFSAPSTQLVAGPNTLILTVAPNAATAFWLYRLEIDLKSS